MRMISLAIAAASMALLSSAALAQQQPPRSLGETIGSPPPLPGPPPAAGPPPLAGPMPSAASPQPQTGSPAPKGYTGAYAPASDNSPAPVFNGPLPESTTGSGLNVVAEDGVSTQTVKAVPCGLVARETDGSTTCVGISDEKRQRRRR
jgi:hypothetical protein